MGLAAGTVGHDSTNSPNYMTESKKSANDGPQGTMDEPVFIVGCARSGSSLLERVLREHPRFQCRDAEDPSVESIRNIAEAKVFSPNPSFALRPNALRYMLEDQQTYNAFLRRTERLRKAQQRLPKALRRAMLSPRVPGRSLLWSVSPYTRVAKTFFCDAKEATGQPRLLEKSPHALFQMPLVRAAFPRCQALAIIRHPLDTFASMQRFDEARKKDGRPRKFTKYTRDVNAFVRYYRAQAAIALRHARKEPNHFQLVKYEDLVADPGPAIHDLLSFLGEADGEAEAGKAGSAATTEACRSRPHGIRELREAFMDHVAWETAVEMEGKLEPLMNELGYEPYTATRAKALRASAEESRAHP